MSQIWGNLRQGRDTEKASRSRTINLARHQKVVASAETGNRKKSDLRVIFLHGVAGHTVEEDVLAKVRNRPAVIKFY